MMAGRLKLKIRRFEDPELMKEEEYAYWQSRPPHERLQASAELTLEAYRLSGQSPDVQRLQRTLVRIKRP
jgi:hypothetical protein